MLLGALLMVLGHAGAWLLAIAIQAKLRTGSRALDITGACVLHTGIVTILVLLVGSMNAIGLWGLATAGLAAGALGAAIGGRALRSVAQAAGESLRAAREENRALFWTATTLIALVGTRALFNTLLYGPTVIDGAEYHLPKLGCWIQSGGLQRPNVLDGRLYFPAGLQVLQVWWVGFLHHDVIIEGAALELIAMGSVACAAIARRFDASRPASLLAGALFLSSPAALLQGASELNDAALAGMVIAAFAFASHPKETGSALALAVAAVGLGAGIKPTMLFALPGIALLAFLSARALRPVFRRPHVILMALALFAGAYWYMMNTFEYQNPLYPVMIGGDSARVGGFSSTIATRPTLSRFAGNVVDLFTNHLVRCDSYNVSPVLPNTTGWGWALTLLGIPATLALAIIPSVSRGAWRTFIAAMLLSVLSTMALVQADEWKCRFVIWFAGLLSVAVVCVCAPSRVRSAVLFLAAIGSGINVLESFVPPIPYVDNDRFAALRLAARTPLLERSAGTLMFVPLDGMERELAERNREAVMCVTTGFPVYALFGPDFGRRVHFIVTDNPKRLLDEMRANSCTLYFVINAPPGVIQCIEHLVREGKLTPIAPAWFRLTK